MDQDSTEVLNMRVQTAEEVEAGLFAEGINPNLPKGKEPAKPAGESQ